MRTKRQLLYDSFYYNFERNLTAFFFGFHTWKQHLGIRYDKKVYDAYKNTIVPYWARFGVKPKLCWTKQTYDHTGSLDPRYIPDDLFHRDIIPHFNDVRFMQQLTDKNMNSILFPDAKRPVTVFKHSSNTFCQEDFLPISRERALSLFRSDGNYVVKPTLNSSSGCDVKFFTGALGSSEIEKILESYEKIDYIVQEAVEQHPTMAALNPSSVNTLRVFTLVFHGEPIILSSVVRVGGTGSRVDNVAAGGYQCSIRPDGRLETLAYSERSGKATLAETTDNGTRFDSIVIPCYDEVCRTALYLAPRVPHLRMIAWDFCLDTQGDVVLIEFNASSPAQNQGTCGPTFADRTEAVLAEVYGKEKPAVAAASTPTAAAHT